jgi:hypothetical protein
MAVIDYFSSCLATVFNEDFIDSYGNSFRMSLVSMIYVEDIRSRSLMLEKSASVKDGSSLNGVEK